MENVIEGRAILGMLCFIHMFILYASQCPWGHIKRKVLDGIILMETIAVTTYIIYDNLQTPPYDGWLLAILGYILVYGLIFMTWVMYGIFTVLEKDKFYEMAVTRHVHFMNEDYLVGTVVETDTAELKRDYTVLLPYSPELYPLIKANIKPKVKFDNVLKGNILVKLVQQNN